VQFVTAEDPAGELESDGQVVHVEIDVALTTVEYVDALSRCNQTAHRCFRCRDMFLVDN